MYKTRSTCNDSQGSIRQVVLRFNKCRARYQHTGAVAAMIVVLLMASCAPYPVKPVVSRTESVSLATDEAIVTWEPRFLLKKFSEAVREAHQNIEVVDEPVLLDLAIPQGERTLRQVLQPDACRRIAEQLNVAYLVLVSPLYEHEGEIEGPLMIFMGAWGVAKQELEARLGATVFDLQSGKPLCNVTGEADATMVFAGWFFPFVVGPWAEGDLNTIRSVAAEVGKAISEDAKSENVRIVVAAVVSDREAIEGENLMNWAIQGDADAQYQIHWGLTRPENLRWLCLAADQQPRDPQSLPGTPTAASEQQQDGR